MSSVTGQLGEPYLSTLGNLVAGLVLTVESDPNSPTLYPSSCGPGSTGGTITGANVPFKHSGEHRWPTR